MWNGDSFDFVASKGKSAIKEIRKATKKTSPRKKEPLKALKKTAQEIPNGVPETDVQKEDCIMYKLLKTVKPQSWRPRERKHKVNLLEVSLVQ